MRISVRIGAAAWPAVAAAVVVVLGGCDAGPRPELQMDVVVQPTSVALSAIEVDRPDACTRPFNRPGQCSNGTDVISPCEAPTPAGWLRALRVEVNGVSVAHGSYAAPFGGQVNTNVIGVPGAALIVTSSDGDEVTIPLPAVAAPIATIDGMTDDGTRIDVIWRSQPPAASAVAWMGDGLVSSGCHRLATEPTQVPSPGHFHRPGWNVGVTAYAAPISVDTAFGQAMVWVSGGGTSQPLP